MSKMPKPLPGIFFFTGAHGVGKTNAALQCGANPDRMLFVDDDLKGAATVRQLKEAGVAFGQYVDLAEISKGKTEYGLHTWGLSFIENIKPDVFDVCIWDTWTQFAKTFYSYVVAHENQFRREWAKRGDFKGMQHRSVAKLYEAQVLAHLQKKIPTVILTGHLKPAYINNVQVPDKEAPDVSDTIDRTPRARFWLRRNPSGSPVPVALVMKRFDIPIFKPGVGLRSINVLPEKITPLPEEESVWDAIERYYNNPMGNRPPRPEELPDEYEMSILSGALSEDQKHLFEKMLDAGVAQREEEEAINASIGATNEQIEQIQKMARENKPTPLIATKLGIDPGLVSTVLAMSESGEETFA